jgi:hypothetical protein
MSPVPGNCCNRSVTPDLDRVAVCHRGASQVWHESVDMDDDGNSFATFDKAPKFFESLSDFLNADLQREPTVAETEVEQKLSYKLIIIVRKAEFHTQCYIFVFMLMLLVGGIPRASILTRSVSGANGDTCYRHLQSARCRFCHSSALRK